MLILILYIIFLFVSLNYTPQVKTSPPCLGYNATKSTCVTCYYNYYPSMALIQNISTSQCQSRITNSSYLSKIYVSNQTTCNLSICNGSFTNPYISLFTAFESEMNKADQYNYSELSFYLMGSPHYVLRKDLVPQTGLSLRQFFRRINVKLYIGPLLCNDQFINESLCFSLFLNGSIKTMPIVYLKTSEFFIFVANQLTIENIFFDGRDLPLHRLGGTTNSSNYNINKIYCTDAYLEASTAISNCVLRDAYLSRIIWNLRNWSYGLFNLEGFFDNPQMMKPRILINNSVFQWIYPMTLDNTWLTLIYVNDIPGDVIIENMTFYKSEMYFGLIYYNLFTLDRFFKYYDVYNASSLSIIGNIISIKNSNITAYNWENTYDSSYYGYYGANKYVAIICIYNFGNKYYNSSIFAIKLDFCMFNNINFNYYEQNSVIYMINSTNLLINNFIITQVVRMYGIVILDSYNLNITNFYVSNFINNYEIMDIENSNLQLYNFTIYNFTTYLTTSTSACTFTIQNNAIFNMTLSNFTRMSYTKIIITNSLFIAESMVFSNSIYYMPIFLMISSRITVNNSYLTKITSYSSANQGIFESKINLYPYMNTIVFNNFTISNSSSKLGYFFVNRISNSNDTFSFNCINFTNISFVYVFLLPQINKMSITNTNYYNITAGQLLHAAIISTEIIIINLDIFANNFPDTFIWISSSLAGTVNISNISLHNCTIGYYQFLQIDAGNIYLDKFKFYDFKINYVQSTEIDILKLSGNEIFLNELDVRFFNSSLRNFIYISYSVNFLLNNSNFLSLDLLYTSFIYANSLNNTNNMLNNSSGGSSSNSSTNSMVNGTVNDTGNVNITVNTTNNKINDGSDTTYTVNYPIGTYLIILAVKYTFNITVNNVSLLNLYCYQSSKRIGEENGIMAFWASDDTILKELLNHLTLSNLNLSNISLCKSGCLGFVNIHDINIYASYFNNMSVLYSGGVLSIEASTNITIYDIIVYNSSAINGNGGAFDFSTVIGFVNIYNFYLTISEASNGGGIRIDTVSNFILQNSSFFNVSSSNEAGGIYITESTANIINTNFSFCSAGYLGGVFNVYYGNLNISGVISNSAYAVNGGFIYIGIITLLNLKNSLILNSSSESDGINIMINDCSFMLIEHTSFMNSTSSYGSGNIYIENQNFYEHFLKDVMFENSRISLGSCIYYNSNDDVTIEGFKGSNNQGVLFYMTSQSNSYVILKDLMIYDNNINGVDPVPKQIFYLKSIMMAIYNVNIIRTIADEALFELDTCDFQSRNSSFSEILDIYSPYIPTELILIYGYSSNISLFDNLMDNNNSLISLIYLKCEEVLLSIINSVFVNGCSLDQSILIIISSDILINSSNFSNNIGKITGVAHFQYSHIEITHCVFDNNTNYFFMKPSNIYVFEDMITNIFVDNYNAASLGDVAYYFHVTSSNFTLSKGISIYAVSPSYVNVINSSFIRSFINQTIFANALLLLEVEYIWIQNTNFSNFSSDYGSGVYIYSQTSYYNQNIKFNSNSFQKCTAMIGGAFYIYGDYNISMTDNKFIGNRAQINGFQSGIGGTGYFICLDCQSLVFELYNNFFLNNYAENFAGTIFSHKRFTTSDQLISLNYFFNNSDYLNFSQKLVSFPLRVYFFNYTINHSEFERKGKFSQDYIEMSEFSLNFTNNQMLSLSKNSSILIASSQLNKFSLVLTDKYSQILIYENAATSKINSFDNILVDKGSNDSKSGIISYTEVKLNKEPGTYFQMYFETAIKFSTYLNLPSNYPQKMTLLIYLEGFSRDCIVGERYNPTDFSCTQCPYGQYSLEDPMNLYRSNKSIIKCYACPDNAACWNGNQMSPNAGYWRNSENSSLILECIAKDACLGFQPIGEGQIYDENNKNMYITGRCADNQGGKFCYICDKGYARMSSKQICEPCNNNFWMIFKFVIAIVSLLFYIFLQVKITFKTNNTTYMGILLKLLMNHLQQISMISLVQLGWTPNIKDYFNYQEFFSFISEEFISIDCFIQNLNIDLIAEKVIFSSILPILLSIIAFFLWVFLWTLQFFLKTRISLKHYLLNRTKVTMLIITYLMFPEILRKCFSLMNCIEIDDYSKKQVLLLSPDLYCWDSQHIKYLLVATLPGLIIWGMLTPMFLMFLLYRFRMKIQENIRIMQKRFSIFTRKTGDPLSVAKILAVKSSGTGNYGDSYLNSDIKLLSAAEKIGQKNRSKKSILFEKIQKIEKTEKTEKIERIEKFYEKSGEKFENIEKIEKIEKIETIEKFQKSKKVSNFEGSSGNFLNTLMTKKAANDASYDAINSSQSCVSKGLIIVKNDEPTSREINDNRSQMNSGEKSSKKSMQKQSREEIRRMTSNLGTLAKIELDLQKEFGYLLKFLYRGYAHQYYYWEIVLYTKKFLLIFIGSFSEFFPNTTKATILLIILTYYLFLQARKKPYENYFLNNIEYFSLIVTFLTANAGIMLFTNDLHQYSQIFLLIIISINVSFFGLWGYYFYIFVIKFNLEAHTSKSMLFFKILGRVLKFIGFLTIYISIKNGFINIFGGIMKILKKTTMKFCGGILNVLKIIAMCVRSIITKCFRFKFDMKKR